MARLVDIQADIAEIKTTLVRNTVTLEDHVRRTTLLEEQLEPVKKHVAMIQGAIKLLGLLVIAAELLKLLLK